MDNGQPAELAAELVGSDGAVQAIGFRPSGRRLLAVAGQQQRVWEIEF